AETFFTTHVLPVLKQHCFECHSHAAKNAKGGLMLDSRRGWEKGGDSGPALVPGKPDESLLIQAIRYEDLEMPPKGKLPPDAVAPLERWVRNGAADPRVFAASEAASPGDREAGRTHWAFQPVRPLAAPPAVQDSSWPLDEADHYILAGLEARGL